jgi:hypothetical protein
VQNHAHVRAPGEHLPILVLIIPSVAEVGQVEFTSTPLLAAGIGDAIVDPRKATVDDDDVWSVLSDQPANKLIGEPLIDPMAFARHDNSHDRILAE